MTDISKVFITGRVVRDPDCRMTANGGKVAKFGIASNKRKRNKDTQEWEDVPLFIDVEVWNRGQSGTQADVVEKYVRKGARVAIDGQLKMDTWFDQATGGKRTKIFVESDNFTVYDYPPDGEREERRKPEPKQEERQSQLNLDVPF